MPDKLDGFWDRSDIPDSYFSGDEVIDWDDGLLDLLLNLKLIRKLEPAWSVTCDSCDDDHYEEVITLQSGPADQPRFYISCPQYGRVRVPEPRLQRYGFHFEGIARAIAKALSLSGSVKEVEQGRIWFLGRATYGSSMREFFLSHGLTWPDAGELIRKCASLMGSHSPVVFHMGRLPAKDSWPGTPPPSFTLSQICDLSDDDFTVHHEFLDYSLSEKLSSTSPVFQRSFPIREGVAWEDITFILRDDILYIDDGEKREEFPLKIAGFTDKRNDEPDHLYGLLKIFAHRRYVTSDTGELSEKARNNLKQHVSQLRKRIKNIVPLKEDPFYPYSKLKRYQARFKLQLAGKTTYPVPDGTTWDQVTLNLIQEEILRVTVDQLGTFKAYGEDFGDNDEIKSWMAAQDIEEHSRDFSFKELGLHTTGGKVNSIGCSLVHVLQQKGNPIHQISDEEVIKLNAFLRDFLQMESDPLELLKDHSWQPLFEAKSYLSQ